MDNYKKSVTDRDIISYFISKTLVYKKPLFFASILNYIAVICLNTLLPFLTGKILASLAHSNTDVTAYMIWFLIFGIIGYAFNKYSFVEIQRLEVKTITSIRADAITSLFNKSLSFHNNNVSGKLISEANEITGSYNDFMGTVMIDFIPLILTLTVGLIIIFYNSLILGIVMLFMAVFSFGASYYARRKMSSIRINRLAAQRDVTSHLADTVSNVSIVKTFGREKDELLTNKKLSEKLGDIQFAGWRAAGRSGANRLGMMILFEFVFILVVTNLVSKNPALLATGIFAFSYSITIINKVFDITPMFRRIDEALTKAEPMIAAFKDQNIIFDAKDAKDLKVNKAKIEFNNVDFYYEDDVNQRLVLNNLNIRIDPAQKIGLVGPSGSGKSTLTKILLRFEEVKGGSILIDDQDISKVTQKSLRQNIAYVPQEPLLFHRTIKENICYGRPEASDKEILLAAQRACADDFISKLPYGYDTIVGERGVKLSGGQRQRIAIARAILKDAPIIILDEATSSLDSQTEKVIQKALGELTKNKTTLVIAHRLSTIREMDKILILDKGNLVQEGTHNHLIRKEGMYKTLWEHQTNGFVG